MPRMLAYHTTYRDDRPVLGDVIWDNKRCKNGTVIAIMYKFNTTIIELINDRDERWQVDTEYCCLYEEFIEWIKGRE